MFARAGRLLTGGTLGQYLGIQPGMLPMATGPVSDDNQGEVIDAHDATRSPTERWRTLPSSELLRLSKDVASGLHCLHTNGIVHRDVKHANVMLEHGATPKAKLCDFGISTLKNAVEGQNVPSFSSMGTPRYQAPEMTQLMNRMATAKVPGRVAEIIYEPSVDIYSFGLLLYEIMHGVQAFGDLSPLAAMLRAADGARPTIALRPEHAPFAAVIEACWDADAHRRPTIATVVEVHRTLEAGEKILCFS